MVEFDHEKIQAFVMNKDGKCAEVSNLPFWWDATPPDARDPDLPNYLARDVLIWSYQNWAFTKRWAWDGLNRLLVTLEQRRERIPDSLKDWACSVVSRQFRDTTFRPPRKQNRKSPFSAQDERDFLIMHVYRCLRSDGLSHEEAHQRNRDCTWLGGRDRRIHLPENTKPPPL